MLDLQVQLSESSLIAILRGLEPTQAISVSNTLVKTGFGIIEVPLNSPRPFESIRTIVEKHGTHAIIGAGTVLTVEQVQQVADVGGRIIVSPNIDPDVGKAAIELGLHWCPGVTTPTEAFKALKLGASILKFFPAELIPPAAISAMRAVLPTDAIIAIVGGVTPDSIPAYKRAGANAFGLGSALFKPQYTLADLEKRAKSFIQSMAETQ
ncbi:2-dehydro-3-deoxy-6-phosphogalactonate aldolase [Rhodobacterales bacterium FZCC0069]|nr:2-dehydro-3-deoxy-6-phosphogalactonate aldolase [Rhodobacterales bacterium FZCC0069]